MMCVYVRLEVKHCIRLFVFESHFKRTLRRAVVQRARGGAGIEMTEFNTGGV